MRTERKGRRGSPRWGVRAFTLIELIVVVAILALLAAGIVPYLMGAQDKALEDACRSEIRTYREACIQWKTDIGSYPQSLSDLFRTSAPTYLPSWLQTFDRDTRRGWHGPYCGSGRVYGSSVADPFDRSADIPALRRFYRYQPPLGFPDKREIRSAGINGIIDDADDLMEQFQ